MLETVERIADRAILLAHGRCIANLRTQDIGSEGLEQLFLERIQESRDAPGSP